MKKKRQSRGKTIRPTFFVFCEGESEEAYVKYLRSQYRLPIEICPSVAGLNINQDFINKFKRTKSVDPKDRDYLMYDLDRDDILERLQKIKGATIIASNPCLEVWYLLHYAAQKTEISSSRCFSLLKKHLPRYKKGEVSGELQSVLESNRDIALARAKSLKNRANPSTDMPLFHEDLEKGKNLDQKML